MKKNLFLAGIILFCASTVAAQEVETAEGSKIFLNGVSYDFSVSWQEQIKCKHRLKSHYGSLGLAFSGLQGLKDYDVEPLTGRSYTVMWNFADAGIPLNRHFFLVSGMGLDFTRYHFLGSVSLRDIDGKAEFVRDNPVKPYKDSKALFTYFKVPTLLEYQTGFSRKGKSFFIQGGLEFLFKIWSKSEIIAREDTGLKRHKFGGYNCFPANMRFLLRVGVSGISVFGYYQPTPLFQQGKGPELYPFGIGISIFN
jgi:hypothetical protein